MKSIVYAALAGVGCGQPGNLAGVDIANGLMSSFKERGGSTIDEFVTNQCLAEVSQVVNPAKNVFEILSNNDSN